jgi:pyruvate,water dikinase
MMNIGEPTQAFMQAQIPNFGVGLARLEFIINEYIKIHPLALLDINKVKNKGTQAQIKKIVREAGYSDKRKFFIDRLAEGIARIGAAFYPKDVIVRLSDFKTNEYQFLIGGSDFEPAEQNPMIGWRGASRYYDEKFLPAFKMECAAFKKVRDEFGLTNVKIMVPFTRTIEEGKKVLEVMNQNGLKRGKNGLKVYMMVEIPANVILAEDFAKIFDGFSIGSNDLTQLTLGLDRDAGTLKVAGMANEKNEAVKRLISQVIAIAKKTKTKIGICGQGPSDFPDFAEFLVREGINSISLNPDTVLRTMINIAKLEKRMLSKKVK